MNATQNAASNGTAVTGIDIAGHLVRDPQRAIAFYRDILGLRPTEIDGQGRGAGFTLADGSTLGLWNDEGQIGGRCA